MGVGKNGDVVKCNEFFMLFSEQPNLSDYNYNPEWAAKERQKKGEAPDVQNEVSYWMIISVCNSYHFWIIATTVRG